MSHSMVELGVSRQAFASLVNGHARCQLMAEAAMGFGSTPETWIRLQASFDVAQARAGEDEIEVAMNRNQYDQ